MAARVSYIAAVDAATGRVTAWNPTPDSPVRTLAVSHAIVYAGGDFRSIGGRARSRIAALGARTGRATAWNPHADSGVLGLAVSGSTVYAAGFFTRVGGRRAQLRRRA